MANLPEVQQEVSALEAIVEDAIAAGAAEEELQNMVCAAVEHQRRKGRVLRRVESSLLLSAISVGGAGAARTAVVDLWLWAHCAASLLL